MKCEPCNGSGYVAQTQRCSICDGAGYVDETSQCPDCSGSGYITGGACSECVGSGSVNDETCGSCGGSGKEDDSRCGRCETSGQITQRRDCPSTVDVQVSCEPCGGTGQVPELVSAEDWGDDEDGDGGGGSAAGASGRARRQPMKNFRPGVCTLYILDQDASAERNSSVPLVQTQEFSSMSRKECEALAAKTDRCIKWDWGPVNSY